ncbi:MAG: hypothetical protein CL992_01195 [Euryarchaeota archaeon]|nr:hypothetical protein [Euryarchaeota archaeon]
MSPSRKANLLLLMLLLSAFSGLMFAIPIASAATSSGTIQSSETWSGSHSVTGDIHIPAGVKVTVQPNTQVTLNNGTKIVVEGNLCISSTSCGASGNGQSSFTWRPPNDQSAYGDCTGITLVHQNQLQRYYDNIDPSCGEGIVFKKTVDAAQTGIEGATFSGAYGIPSILQNGDTALGAVIIEGASISLKQVVFQAINSTNVLVQDDAAPTIEASTFSAGVDGQDADGAALQIREAGSLQPVTVRNNLFKGSAKGCSSQDNGRHSIYIRNSYILIDGNNINDNSAPADYGIYTKASVGNINGNNIKVNCNGIDLNSRRSLNGIVQPTIVNNNQIETDTGAPVTAYDNTLVTIQGNVLKGASESSAIQVSDAEAHITGNQIGPVGGFNGIWAIGGSVTWIDNNTISETTKEPILINEFQFRTQRSPNPQYSRIADNTITSTGTCSTTTVQGQGDYPCPTILAFSAVVSLIGNNLTGENGIWAHASIVSARENIINAQNVAVLIRHYDNKDGVIAGPTNIEYASLGYFEDNDYTGTVPTQVYNVTKSTLIARSEGLPALAPGQQPIRLGWVGYENENVTLLAGLIPLVPDEFPVPARVTANATIFQFADFGTQFDLGLIDISAGKPSAWVVQVQRSELVRYQVRALVDDQSIPVPDALVSIKDPSGVEIFNITTDADGYTPRLPLASDFHLDFRGNGENPNNRVGDPGENSCADGFDNDGDGVADYRDSDCQGSGRELARYLIYAEAWGGGQYTGDLTLTGTVDSTLLLSNMAPTVNVNQQDGVSFGRVIEITGSAWDGVRKTSFDNDCGFDVTQEVAELCDKEQRGSMFGVVHRVEVLLPGSSEWIAPRQAIDASNAPQGTDEMVVNNTNHPFSSWYFTYDMTGDTEGDKVFRFRAWDGYSYSNEVIRTFKLNMDAPVLYVSSPGSGAVFSKGTCADRDGDGIEDAIDPSVEETMNSCVLFTGTAIDAYTGAFGSSRTDTSDVKDVYVTETWADGTVNGPFPIPNGGGEDWSWTWNFKDSISGIYTFTFWAADSDFCRDPSDSPVPCSPVDVRLTIQNQNQLPRQPDRLRIDNEPVDFSTPNRVDGETFTLTGDSTDPDGQVTVLEWCYVRANQLDKECAIDQIERLTLGDNGPWVLEVPTNLFEEGTIYTFKLRVKDNENQPSENWEAFEIKFLGSGENIQENRAPVFDDTGWEDVPNRLKCDDVSKSDERCGAMGRGWYIDMSNFFSDPDGDELVVAVKDNAEGDMATKIGLVQCNIYLNCTYNPGRDASMLDPEVYKWDLQNLIFVARDPWGEEVESQPFDLAVEAWRFAVYTNDPSKTALNSNVTAAGGGTYNGQGLPGLRVVLEVNSKSRQTVIDENGTWSIKVKTADFIDGRNEISVTAYLDTTVFYKNEEADLIIVDKETEASVLANLASKATTGRYAWLTYTVIALAVAALGVVLFFSFFTVIDEEDEAEGEGSGAAAQADPYAWTRQDSTSSVAVPQQAAAPQQVPTAPGWKWDPVSNQWVPDYD